jgi:methyl-accepting chemotaxis protein
MMRRPFSLRGISTLASRLGAPISRFRLTISRAMIAFAVLFVVGFAAVVATGYITVSKLEIHGPAYKDIMLGTELVGDIQPPPIFTMEAYILAMQVNQGIESVNGGKKRLAALKETYQERKAYWEKSALAGPIRTELNMVIIGNNGFWTEMETVFFAAAERGDKAAMKSSFEKLSKTFNIHAGKITRLVSKVEAYQAGIEANAAADKTFYQSLMFGTAGLVLVLVGAMLTWLHRRMVKAISVMAGYMGRLAADDYEQAVPFAARRDEIGEMAKAVAVFRDAGLEKRRLESEAEATRSAIEGERASREAETAESQRAARFAVETIGQSLHKLAEGDLVSRIETRLNAGAEPLRADFNVAVDKLQRTLLGIHGAAAAIRTGLQEISTASDDLSRRSEQQAASLEETAAALDHITETVRKTADGAGHARKVVAETKANAETSSTVVRQAIEAMGQIEKSSRQISNIIGVIDEIAFQTNLLALNAGVEAARAGEAGRGFAVVASEVRSLAQRSAEAAKEIKQLIGNSTAQVDSGVRLVADTGNALERIMAQVNDINAVVVEIAASASEQSTGLREVNIAVGQMDQVTQQNAAMVEETTAASHNLSREAGELVRLIGQFNVGVTATPSTAAPSRPAAHHALAHRAPVSGALAVKVADADPVGDWEEF